ncbi:MAG: hypothetical protein K0R29_2030 [Pseudobdellovibrio sp.]|jgi:hypothetical protein|nr:hypothetical protein [Pseudobdellovibrio sp.]
MKNSILVFVSASLMVQVSSAKMTRLKHAHHHGSAKLGMAFDDKNGRLDFKVSADSILGFENAPKNERQRNIQISQFALLENKISEMVVMAPELACTFTKEKIEREADAGGSKKSKAEHSDVVAVFNIGCNKSPVGSKITFNFQKFFPKLNDIDAAIVAGDLQKSLEIKKSGTILELAK